MVYATIGPTSSSPVSGDRRGLVSLRRVVAGDHSLRCDKITGDADSRRCDSWLIGSCSATIGISLTKEAEFAISVRS